MVDYANDTIDSIDFTGTMIDNTMLTTNKPYLIIPKLIEQATWGGDYILQLKHWQNKDFLRDKKIGQSYELFGDSKLMLHVTNTNDSTFIPEFGFADKPDTVKENFPLAKGRDFDILSSLVEQDPENMLGTSVYHRFGNMPLLIKINQAAGNSFQLHIKPGVSHPRWKPKPESWYYLEDGSITCGIKAGTDVDDYKKTCHLINDKMKELSTKVQNGTLSLDSAKTEAKTYIQELNPWQFVNCHETKKYDLIDLSEGGIHHSWEENKEKHPLGNIVYEVQMDVMDPFCTIRSFDQGKIKEDGTIREIHIDDFFAAIDTDPEHNDINNLRKTRQGNTLLRTPNYALDIFEISDKMMDNTADSFCHLYVRDGEIEVQTDGGSVHMTQGHSCFLPAALGEYEIEALNGDAVVLKTFIAE